VDKSNEQVITRRTFIQYMGFLAAEMALVGGCAPSASKEGKKIIVLGFDGMDPIIAREMMDGHQLPHFNKLKRSGAYTALRTTWPPQSPVAWSSFATSLNPGGHAIHDFLSRDPQTYLPRISMAEVAPPTRTLSLGKWKIPLGGPEVHSLRKGEPFWDAVAKHDIPATVLWVPVTFPPSREVNMLSGLGTPDLLGTQGTFSFYTTQQIEDTRDTGGRVLPITPDDDRFIAFIEGPPNSFRSEDVPMKIPFTVRVDERKKQAVFEIQGEHYTLRVGQWAPWIRLRFEMLPTVSLYGICRFYLKSVHPALSLYVTPLNIDPENPSLPISNPEDYAGELVRKFGLFYTQGMPEDTWALNERRLDEKEFMQIVDTVMSVRARILMHEVERLRSGLLAAVFTSSDRIQHMLWRYTDPESPAYDPDEVRYWGMEIRNFYRRMDALLGRVMKRMRPDTTLIVLSDHGFAPYRRSVNLNTWLLRNDFMRLRRGGKESAEFFDDVDWGRTRAYALGMNSVYLNLAGREGHGIVQRGTDADRTAEELFKAMAGMRDPSTGRPVVYAAVRTRDVYGTTLTQDAPDVIVGYDRGFRASWHTALGAAPEAVFEDNTSKWSGDHCMCPQIVPGVLFANRQVSTSSPHIMDVAPTVLALLGVKVPPAMQGKKLFG